MLDTDYQQLVELSAGESDDFYDELTCAALDSWEAEEPFGLPFGFDDISPGPLLGAILSAVDLSRLTGHDVVRVMQAEQRQASHHEARKYEAMCETARSVDPDSTTRSDVANEYAPEEIGAALTLTRRMANRELSLALDLVEEVPAVFNTLSQGQIDQRRAAVLADQTTHLDPETRQAVVKRVIDDAPDLTTGQLGARLRRLTAEADPKAANKLFERSLSERRVAAEPNLEGTAALIIQQCSPDNVYAARDHINGLARRLKTADEPRDLDQLRADVAIDLLTGRIGSTGKSRGAINLTVDLETLGRISDSAGELDGYGPVVAELARKVAREQKSSKWTAVVSDPETGEPLHAVQLRRRPTAKQVRKIRALHPSCVHPGCRVPAANCDLDHTIDHAKGGSTTVRNHAPLCRRHHLAKHRGGWSYRRTGRTEVEWTSPLGHVYRSGRPP